jgi:hypothetical protein
MESTINLLDIKYKSINWENEYNCLLKIDEETYNEIILWGLIAIEQYVDEAIELILNENPIETDDNELDYSYNLEKHTLH